MLAKIGTFVKAHEAEIVLVVAVFLVSSLSFSVGYITGKKEVGQPIEIIHKSQ